MCALERRVQTASDETLFVTRVATTSRLRHRHWSAGIALSLMALTVDGTPTHAQPRPVMVARRVDLSSLHAETHATSSQLITSVGTTQLPNTGTVALANHQLIVQRLDLPVKLAVSPKQMRLQLPYHFVMPDSRPGAAPGAILQLGLMVIVDGGGMHFNPALGKFVGRLLVGVTDSLNQRHSLRLPQPVAILLAGEPTEKEPASFTLTATNIDAVQAIELRERAPDDSLVLRIIPTFDPEGVEVTIPVKKEAVIVDPETLHVAGFGLGVAHLSVTLPAGIRSDGPVQFTSDLGDLEPRSAPSGTGALNVRLRSVGVGRTVVRAKLQPFRTGRALVVFDWPTWFIGAALLGGAMGAMAESLLRKRRRNQPSWVKPAISGMIIGLVLAVAYAAGMHLFPIEVVAGASVNEAAIFVIAAVGGAFGMPLLKQLVPGIREALDGKEV